MSSYWSEYWRQGHLTSFGEDIKDNYKGCLAALWTTFFKPFQSADMRIVDVGTGNGALIDLAINNAGCQSPHFYGIDSASLVVPSNLKKDNITFYSQTPVEALPFVDNTVDIVVSQFGVEYSDITIAVNEILRVLKPAGKIKFVIHHNESSIVNPNRRTLQAATRLTSRDGPMIALRQLINAMAKFGVKTPQAEKARGALNEALHHFASSNQEGIYGTGFPVFLKAVMKPTVSFKERKSMLTMFEKELQGQVERLNDLVNAAMSETEIESLKTHLTAKGFCDIALSELIESDGKLIGWNLDAVKL